MFKTLSLIFAIVGHHRTVAYWTICHWYKSAGSNV